MSCNIAPMLILTPVCYFLSLFEYATDFNDDGVSQEVDWQIDDLVNGDFNDNTVVMMPEPMMALFIGTGIAPRAPARR